MWTRQKEFSLAQLVEDPAVGKRMEETGIDRRCIDLMLELSFRRPEACRLPLHAPLFS